MKKLWTTPDYKRMNTKRGKDSLERNILYKLKKKIKRKKKQGLKKEVIKKQRIDSTYTRKPAPADFSFISNTEEVLRYLEELKTHFNKNQNVLVDLKNVTNITNDAIVLLLAFINNPAIVKGSHVRGNYPKNEILKRIMVESGLFNQIQDENKPRNYILTRRNKKAEGRIADELIRRVTKVVFGETGRCPGVYKALMECMANTCYHAKPKKTAYETWWLTVYHDKKNNRASFAFIDTGVGIFNSNKMRDFKDKFASFFGLSDNREILKEILSGHKRSSTKIPYRGKGLPAIYKGLERNYYSNLKIISNNVKADLETDTYIQLDQEFKGTFLYWELNDTNRWTK